MIPFAGTHRLIDFTIGNPVNTGIASAWVVTRAGATLVEQYVERLRGRLLEATTVHEALTDVEGTAEAVAHILPTALRHRQENGDARGGPTRRGAGRITAAAGM